MKQTKNLFGIILLFICSTIHAQENEVNSEEFFLDYSGGLHLDWIYPSEKITEIDFKDILLKVGVKSDEGIKNIAMTLNGMELINNQRGFRVGYPGYKKFIEQNITLHEGGNILKISVEDKAGNITDSEKTIVVSTVDVITDLHRKDRALLFATDTYDEWDDLANPIHDARTIGEELEDSYDFDVEIIENATQDEIMIKIREYAQKSYLEYDQLFIFFAGHGQYDEILGQGYIVSANSKRADQAKSSYISHAVLRNAIDNIPSRHTLLAMDVCFGGTFDPTIARSGLRGSNDMYEEITTSEFVKRKMRFKTRKYITSGGKTYVFDGREGSHSPFASKLLNGLRSYGGRDDVVTLPELYNWLEKLTPEPRVGSFGTDEPGSDFVFVVNQNK